MLSFFFLVELWEVNTVESGKTANVKSPTQI